MPDKGTLNEGFNQRRLTQMTKNGRAQRKLRAMFACAILALLCAISTASEPRTNDQTIENRCVTITSAALSTQEDTTETSK